MSLKSICIPSRVNTSLKNVHRIGAGSLRLNPTPPPINMSLYFATAGEKKPSEKYSQCLFALLFSGVWKKDVKLNV